MGHRDSSATPATKALRAAGVGFTERPYAHESGVRDYGHEAAQSLGGATDLVHKTLVVDAAGWLALAIIPVSGRLSRKAVAAALGVKRVQLAGTREAERITGYVAGGISPFGTRTALPTLLDAGALTHDRILVSGGRRGLALELDPHDLVAVTGATVAPLLALPS